MENFDKNKYFNQFPNISVRDNELYFKDINLLKLAKENGIDKNSIKVCCADVIKDNILTYKNIVKNVIEKIGYKNKFAYAYASKVNYSKECLLTAYKYVDLVETSSPNDLMLYENLLKRGDVKTPLTIVCNGTKTDEYIDAIDRIYRDNKDVEIICTAETVDELKLLAKRNTTYLVGTRINPSVLNSKISRDEDRFGFNETTFENALNLLRANKQLVFKMVSFHYSHCGDMTEDWLKLADSLMTKFYTKLQNEFPTIDTIDLGGGLPSRGYLKNDFDFNVFAERLFTIIKNACDKNNAKHPLVIGEYGRYTVSDSQFVLAKVNYVQDYDKDNKWYNINTSLMVYMTDSWAFKVDYMILPLNLIENDFTNAKVCGITCDPGDMFKYEQSSPKLPMPVVKDGENLYVAIFLVGSYQNNVSGFGGAHHCLIPEGKEIALDADTGEVSVIEEVQDINRIMKLLHY